MSGYYTVRVEVSRGSATGMRPGRVSGRIGFLVMADSPGAARERVLRRNAPVTLRLANGGQATFLEWRHVATVRRQYGPITVTRTSEPFPVSVRIGES